MQKITIGYDDNNQDVWDQCVTFDDSTYFDYYHPDLIKGKYIYPVLVTAMMPEDRIYVLSDKVLQDIRSKNAVLMFDFTYESRDLTNFNKEIHMYDPYDKVIKNTIKHHKLEDFTYLYADCNPHNSKLSPYNLYFNRWLYMQVTEYLKFKKLIVRKEKRNFKVASFNRRPDENRFMFVKNYFGNNDILCTLGLPDKVDHYFYEDRWPGLLKNLPLEFDENLDLKEPNRVSILKEFLQKESYVQVVNESFFHYSPNHMFITEKTLKPIACLQPFIVNGMPGSLAHLKHLGFKTFDKWWDESYDKEQDHEKRLQKVFAVVDKLLAMSHEEHQDMLLDMFEVLSFNANVLRKYPLIKNIYDDLINLSIYGTKYFSE